MLTPIPLHAEDAEHAFVELLRVHGNAVTPAASVTAFVEHLRAVGIEWRCWRAGANAPRASFVAALVLPGRTAMLMCPGDVGTADIEVTDRLVRCALEELDARPVHYAQCLLPDECGALAGILGRNGFRRLTRLLYLERAVMYPWVQPAPTTHARWIPYSHDRHDTFVDAVASTYENSLDCPELTGARPVPDALASHRAAGPFDPSLWEVAVVADRPAGCLLLGVPAAGLLEVVYMGVAAHSRQQGIGRMLLQRAFEHARRLRARGVTLVVDERNDPARRLYDGFGFRQIAARDGWIRPGRSRVTAGATVETL